MALRSAHLFFFFTITLLFTSAFSNLVLSKVERRIDLTSQIVRTISTLKVENEGPDMISEVLLCFPDYQAEKLAFFLVSPNEGKGKSKSSTTSLPVQGVKPEGMPSSLTFYSVSLPKGLSEGENIILDVFAVFTHSLQPFPEQITQADSQLVLFQDSAYYLSPYEVKIQSLSVRLPTPRVESYTKLQNTKLVDSEIKYGPYENIPAFSYEVVVVHYENNRPFAVARELVREIEISHWGNVQITEHYNLVHGGAYNKGGFSRLDYQARPHVRGVSSFRHLLARLPPRAHSVYYRDEIGNISTSHLRGDSRKTELELEPRYPMFGGWKTSFTIGYGLPLQEYLFESEGKRFLNISFGSPMQELVIDNLIVKIVLPEGSSDVSVSVPFSVKQLQEVKYSHLDIVGRPVAVLERKNAVPEHNMHFQVYYKFSGLSLLREPLMLISGFLFLFISCIIYMHADMSISKSSASYLAKLQWDEVQAAIQQVQNIINRCLGVHDKLETSLRDLSRTGDIQACKAARKAADSYLKELAKDLRPFLTFLQSCPQAAQILPKVEELVAKVKDIEEKLMLKNIMVVDSYEKKSGGREIENKVAALQQKLTTLRHEVDDILEVIDEI
ncbi:Dolichyl-diphosphooligosaccharide--protein glycosyltransferase subunit [Thalictrum thalictroides]|uniref:Dolichyl-diphosphooligosaccharide--protein glycosyltransferase subunit 1 n=1 Tax=Thalictrum thalictroides TaxID=46969 RepID=A0A7J6X491_THATH|nr:Dolichyl-diphosphooligosaccharide--protein glycosyltransferase subunit [Thalictrum thalictroides]